VSPTHTVSGPYYEQRYQNSITFRNAIGYSCATVTETNNKRRENDRSAAVVSRKPISLDTFQRPSRTDQWRSPIHNAVGIRERVTPVALRNRSNEFDTRARYRPASRLVFVFGFCFFFYESFLFFESLYYSPRGQTIKELARVYRPLPTNKPNRRQRRLQTRRNNFDIPNTRTHTPYAYVEIY